MFLITGSNGQLGTELAKLLPQAILTDVADLDITDEAAVKAYVAAHDIDTIINCAAYTAVDKAEDDEALAAKINIDGPRNLALSGAKVVHVSTDYVFGKEPYNVPCNPEQKGTPTGVYGATKLHGEQNIIASGCKYVIIRTAWLYSEFGKNFCKTMLNLTATKPQLKVVFDQCGTPTYALDLAYAIETILEKMKTAEEQEKLVGIYHFSNEGVCSWYDFTQMIARISGHTDCDIQPCYSSEYPSPVTRPAYSVLDKRSIKETFGVKVPYWVDSLEKCIAHLEAAK